MKNFIFNIECPYGCTTQAGSLSLLKKVERLNVSLPVFNTRLYCHGSKSLGKWNLLFSKRFFCHFQQPPKVVYQMDYKKENQNKA